MVSKFTAAQVLLQLLMGGVDGARAQKDTVCVTSVTTNILCEKYLRGTSWNKMKPLFLSRCLSTLAKGQRRLLQGRPGTFYPLVSV